MPVLTKKYLSDQILIKLSGGFVDAGYPVDERDIWGRIEQKINSWYRLQQFSTNLPSGETIPENLAIGIYEGVTVTSSGVISTSILPVMPISLPRNMGVFLIYDPNNPENSFIPIMNGQKALLRTDALLSDLLGQISYEVVGKKIKYSKDLTLMGVTEVTMELVVLDIGQYSSTDMLPIPADAADMLITEIFKEYTLVTPETGAVNVVTNAGQKANP